jgi:hypothetical protein
MGKEDYRIKETIYKDGHKGYIAEEAHRFLFFKWWKPFICDVWDYGYAKVRFICGGKTFDDCKTQLLDCLKQREVKIDANTVISIKTIKL